MSYHPVHNIISVGREAEHAWNIWATQQFLGGYSAFSSRVVPGSFKDQPRQYQHVLEQARVPSDIAYYHHSFKRNADQDVRALNLMSLEKWKPYNPQPLHAGMLALPHKIQFLYKKEFFATATIILLFSVIMISLCVSLTLFI